MSFNHNIDGGRSNFTPAPCLAPDGRICWEPLPDISSRLFSPSRNEFEVLLVANEESEIQSRRYLITEAEGITPTILENIGASQHVFYIIPQEFSYGQLRITESCFKSILSHHRVFSPFLRLLCGFGLKIGEDVRIREGYDARLLACGDYEVCYNLRHVEINGRGKSCPWSLRQTGVYQKYNSGNDNSVWIILHAAQNLRSSLHGDFSSVLTGPISMQNLMLHSRFLAALGQNWDQYVDYLQSAAEKLEEKACFNRLLARVGKRPAVDYSLTFSDCQELHLFQNQLRRAIRAVKAVVIVANGCILIAAQRNSSTDGQVVGWELRILIDRAKILDDKLKSLLNRSSGIMHLLSKVLEFHSQHGLVNLTLAMQQNLSKLELLTSEAAEDRKSMRKLTTKAQTDSTSVRALTIIGTFYVPSSLLAQIFSSNLVQLKGSVQDNTNQRNFVLAPQIWVFFLTAVLFTSITWGAKSVLERRLG